MLLTIRTTTAMRCIILAFFCFSSFWADAQFVLHKNLTESTDIQDQVDIACTGQKHYTITEILQKPATLTFENLDAWGRNIGFSDDYYWLKFSIANKSDAVQSMYLETARPIIDSIVLYTQNQEGSIEVQYNGDAMAYHEKAVQHRKTLFDLTLNPGECNTYFMMVKSDGEDLLMPMKLLPYPVMLAQTYKEQIFYGIFYGILMLAAIIYLFFYFALRDTTFLNYSLYVIFIGLLQFSIDGFSHQYFLPDGGWFSNRAVLASALIAGIFLGKYGETFLAIKQRLPGLYKVYFALYMAFGASLIALLTVPSFLPLCYPIANTLGLFVLLLLIASTLVLQRRKIPVDNYFKAGILFLVLGFVVFILNNFNLIPYSFLSENGPKFGTGLEVIFLSISMSNRIRLLRLENEENQALALQRSKDMNEIKSSFLSNISHELRTPLNLIMGITSSLQYAEKNKEVNGKYDLVLSSSKSLLNLIEDILNFTEIEKGNQAIRNKHFDLSQTLDELIADFKTKAENKGLRFESFTGNNIPTEVIGDEDKLRQILNSLLDNAVKFTEDGFVSFTVKHQKKNKIGSFTFEISDSGIGISKEKMATIFESFTKKSFMDKREFGGLGLGLYLAKNFVDLQDGTIKIENTEAGGVICTVVLDFECEERKVSQDVEEILEVKEFDLEGCNILYIEDNEMNQMVLKMMISQWKNTNIDIANNGEEGIEKLKEGNFDLVLMDLQMPVMDGFEATASIRNASAGIDNMHIPIIAVTADITDKTRKQVLNLGANDYSTKPVNASLLYLKIKEQLRIKSMSGVN